MRKPKKPPEIRWLSNFLERAKRFEPSTLSLATRCSTTELRPHRVWYLYPATKQNASGDAIIRAVSDLTGLHERLLPILEHAGMIACQARDAMSHSLKADGSIVTNADTAVETYLREALVNLLPGSTVWGEEEGFDGIGKAGTWAVDPVDGTSNFRYGSPLWGVSIGLVRDEGLVLGGIFLPDFNAIYSGGLGLGGFKNMKPLPVIRRGPIMPEELVSYTDQIAVRYNSQIPGKMRYLGAYVAEAASFLEGQFRGVISDKPALYDAAAAMAIASELDAEIRYANGDPFDPIEYLGGERFKAPVLVFPKESGFFLE